MSYVIAGYGITAVVLAGYAARVLRRGRAIRQILPDATSDANASGTRGPGWR